MVGGEERKTLQWEGTARQLEAGELKTYTTIFFDKLPRAEKFSTRDGIAYFIATPKLLRYSDFESKPHDIWELTF